MKKKKKNKKTACEITTFYHTTNANALQCVGLRWNRAHAKTYCLRWTFTMSPHTNFIVISNLVVMSLIFRWVVNL